MRYLKTVAAELLGLFVDDAGLALALIGWLLAAWLVLPQLGLPPAWHGVLLFAGLAGILAESVIRRAAKGRAR